MSDKTTVTLRKPLQMGDNLISELVIREPTIGEIINAEKTSGGDAERVLSIVGQVAGYDVVFLKNMVAKDFRAVSRALNAFLEDIP